MDEDRLTGIIGKTGTGGPCYIYALPPNEAKSNSNGLRLLVGPKIDAHYSFAYMAGK